MQFAFVKLPLATVCKVGLGRHVWKLGNPVSDGCRSSARDVVVVTREGPEGSRQVWGGSLGRCDGQTGNELDERR